MACISTTVRDISASATFFTYCVSLTRDTRLFASRAVVRHFVITRHAAEELRELQQAVVHELLAARPKGGFPDHGIAPAGSLEAYVTTNLWWHIRGANGDAPPARALIEDEDRAILECVALAMGEERVTATASAWEAEGDKLGAARLSWLGNTLAGRGACSHARAVDFVYRTADLLAAVASEETAAFEMEVLNYAWILDVRRACACKARLCDFNSRALILTDGQRTQHRGGGALERADCVAGDV